MSANGALFWSKTFMKTTGAPYAGARLIHYAAGTTTNLDVYTDEAATIPAGAEVVADSSGLIELYGRGDYDFEIRSSVADGDNLLYTFEGVKLEGRAATLRGENQGTSLPSAVAATIGRQFVVLDGSGNVVSFNIQDTSSTFISAVFSNTAPGGAIHFAKGADLASSSTLTLGTDGNYFDVTGTTTIANISTLAAGVLIILQFDGVLTLTHGASTIILKDGRDYTTTVGDVLTFISEGAGVWREIGRMIAEGGVQGRKGADIASASTITLGDDGDYFHITGTTTITGLSTRGEGAIVTLEFDSTPSLTHNGTSFILPHGTSGQVMAGSVWTFRSEGGGNWRAVSKVPEVDLQTFTGNGTWTKPAGVGSVTVTVVGGGGGGGSGAASAASSSGGSGGGGAALQRAVFRAADLSATETVTVGAAGTGGAAQTSGNGNDGTAGGDTSFGSHLKVFGGGPGAGGTGGSFTGGSGGGTAGAGVLAAGSDTLGGSPATTVGTAGISGQGAGGDFSADGLGAEYGGASGGGSTAGASGNDGGSSLYGGGGGGGGAGSGAVDAGDGGDTGTYTAGGGGAAGTGGGAGANGADRDSIRGGQGGGGGDSTSGGGNAGAGGNGGTPGGGGGGGGRSAAGGDNSGAGGNGGAGRVYVWSS